MTSQPGRSSTWEVVPPEDLEKSDLVLDACYQGKRGGNAGDDPLHPLLKVSNQGGFRHLGPKESPRLIVITSTLADPDWPDSLDLETGIFTYFGDNKRPGRSLHDTPRWGNAFLRDIFNAAHLDRRHQVPPILIFTNAGYYRDMIFRGLAVPGAEGLSQDEDLVAVWRVSEGNRFQNYRAHFTILDCRRVPRVWLDGIASGRSPLEGSPPTAWLEWVEQGRYRPLRATPSVEIRDKAQQLPEGKRGESLLETLRSYFAEDPVGFEGCAAELVRYSLGNINRIDLTKPTRDGGRDATGEYRIGRGESGILVEFAIEAKCYPSHASVGVREVSRLISRLRHRQFGVLVTTSYVNAQAYREIKEDGHPIVVMGGGDLVNLLTEMGFAEPQTLLPWLRENFPKKDR